jgi:hypothetical protein
LARLRGGTVHLPDPEDRLHSWKEIAAFLGRTVRTVQRWEKTDGLPLKRGGPGQRGVVIASKREIGEWWERRRSILQDDGPANGTSTRGGIGWRAPLVVSLITFLIAITTPVLRPLDGTAARPTRLGRLLAASTSEGQRESFIRLDATPSGLAFSPSGHHAYVALYEERAVAVVDLVARRVIDRVDVIDHPGEVVLSRDSTQLIISGRSELGVLDLRRRTLARFATDGGYIHDSLLSRDGRYVWLTFAQGGLKVLDIETGRLDTIRTIGCPVYLTAAPRSPRVFLSYQCGGPGGRWGHDALEIIDAHTRKPVLSRAGPPLVGSALAISPDEEHLWVDTHDACTSADYDQVGCPPGSGPVLHAFKAETLEPLLTVRVPGEGFQGLPIFYPDGARLVVVGRALNVIDGALGTIYESIGREVGFGAFTPDGRKFIALDIRNRGLREFELSPPADPRVLRDARAHWSGDGTPNDLVGGAHALTDEGLRYEAGRYGQAFSFDGSSKGVAFGRRHNGDMASSDSGAYVAWIKPRRIGAHQHIASRTGPLGWNWSISSEGRLAFCLVQGQRDLSCEYGGLVGRTTLVADLWYHVAIVRSKSAMSMFINGQEERSRALGAAGERPNSSSETSVLRLGAGPDGSDPFHGLIDEVLFFGRGMSADDVADIMRAMRLDALKDRAGRPGAQGVR